MSAVDYKNLPLPLPPPTQAINSLTFKPPPLDGSLTLPEIYDWHYRHTPNHPLFVYANDAGVQCEILWPTAVCAVHRVGFILQSRVGSPKAADKTPVVAILAASDTITYLTVMVGIIRAGYAAFLVSPRNSPSAIAHLLAKVKVKHVLVGAEDALQKLIQQSVALLPDDDTRKFLEVSAMPKFEEIYNDHREFQPLPFERPDMDDAAIILHSSGKFHRFPEAYCLDSLHDSADECDSLDFPGDFGERDLTGKRLSCHAMPMFHGMGMMQSGWTAASGLVISTFKPSSPAIAPTPDSVFKGALDTKSNIVFCVPSFVEAWSRDPSKVRALRATDGILYGGGPLSKEAGKCFTSQGIALLIMYGCTEGGIMSTVLPESVDDDWDYFRISPHIKSYFVPDGEGNYEFMMLAHPCHLPCVLNTKIDGMDGYATSDLMQPHPTKTGYWRIHGRADDQIIHNTGEKTNPGPLENILNRDPHITASVMFGRGRFNAGVLIDPSPAHRFDPSDADKLVAFRNLIWPTVEDMNQYAPQHSRVFKEMILVASPHKPFTYTAKNTPRRQAILIEYDTEIQALYDSVDESTQADIPFPSNWAYDSSLSYVRTVVQQVMKGVVLDEDDLFQHGCDSLQATWIRNSLLRALRHAQCDVRYITSSFVYENPTVIRLATFVSNHASSTGPLEPRLSKSSQMQEMVNKYSQDLPLYAPSPSTAAERSVILTGSTGGLGAILLAQLLQDPSVNKVYGINRRRSDESLIARQRKAFEERGLDPQLLKSPKLVLVEADLNGSQFILVPELVEEIRKTCTHIIHNAYTVDFNVTLQSYEPHVQGLRNLVNLCLSSRLPAPPRLLFISSVSAVRNVESQDFVKETFFDASAAEGSGYSESKWVCERLLADVASRSELRPIIIRVGQVSGSVNGAWKVTDWVPSLIRSSIHLGCLPDSAKNISWIPADVAAASILEMRDATSLVLHLASAKPVPWRTVFTSVSETLGLPFVPYRTWLDKLEASNAHDLKDRTKANEFLRENPALLLIEFFKSAIRVEDNPGKEAFGLPKLSVTGAVKVSDTLRDMDAVSAGDAHRWVEYWTSIGFMSV